MFGLGILFHILISLVPSTWATPVLAPSAVNAVLTYQNQVVIPRKMLGNETVNEQQIRAAVEKQSMFLQGLFENREYTKLITKYPFNTDLGVVTLASLKAVRVLSVENSSKGVRVHFQAAAEILVHQKLANLGETFSIPLMLPINPFDYYDPKCVDKEYPDPEYYFAFWDIFSPKCQSHLGTDVGSFDGMVRTVNGPSMDASPSYARLFASAKQRGYLDISVLIGFNETYSNRDLGRVSFKSINAALQNQGFKVVDYSNTPKTAPFVELMSEPTPHMPIPVHITLMLSDPDEEVPRVFAKRAKKAFENSDVVVYLGHSGLGSNLNLNHIETAAGEKIQFNSRYQVYYLGACESLYWYLNSYELAKRGKRNVDIITYGLSSLFDSQNQEALIFLKAFSSNSQPTWLEILQAMERPLRGLTYFINVGSIR